MRVKPRELGVKDSEEAGEMGKTGHGGKGFRHYTKLGWEGIERIQTKE